MALKWHSDHLSFSIFKCTELVKMWIVLENNILPNYTSKPQGGILICKVKDN